MHIHSKIARKFAAALIPCALAIAAVPFSTATASAAPGSIVFSDAPGTSAPPSTLGSYKMTPFPADTQAVGATVSGVAGPSGTLGFTPSLEHCLTPNSAGCWQTWSNGYSGDVYATSSGSITLTLPAGTSAFYFYAEPDEFETFSISATSDDGTTSGAVPVAGDAGAEYFGFYATGTATLTSITVSGTDPDGFAVGEFGISNGVDHYVVNAEAWIPFPEVVDPYLPLTVPYLVSQAEALNDPNCYKPAGGQLFSTYVSSTYGGDGHAAFGTGTYRLRTEVSFDFDPATDKITNFTEDAVSAVGTSHRYKVYTTSKGVVLDSCVEAATATNTQTAKLDSDTSFTLGYRGKNPLADPQFVTPALTAVINGSLSQDGSLTLSYKTTEFPSQGIQVSVNGNTVATDLENDVSCLSPKAVFGFSGLALIGRGLNFTESGSVTIQPTGNSSKSTPSPLC
jgi:hypothetical protein